jgi:superfamily II DNA or RNA helicase
MRIPYVIDNQAYKLADVLSHLMGERTGCSLDVATAYFNVGAFRLLREGLASLRSFRLLLGFEPATGADVGLGERQRLLKSGFRRDLETEAFAEDTLRLVEDLISFLRQDNVSVRLYQDGFLHAKGYLLYGDKGTQAPLFERLLPLIGIVGSSNFTGAGLSKNRELSLAHKTLLDEEEVNDGQARAAAERLAEAHASERIAGTNRRILKSEVGARAILDLVEWYEKQWAASRDFKGDLVELLDASKFGSFEYSPYDIYLKALYTYFHDELDPSDVPGIRSAVELSEFQEDAVRKARRILAKYDGVLIGDSVGMGKTWIGKKLLEDYAYHQRMKALVVCPASLREMWQRELASATIAAQIVSQEELGRADGRIDLAQLHDADVILVDESHNFRNRGAQRYEALEEIIAANRGRGRSGMRTKVILLTATPINNSIFDLYSQIMLFAQNNRAYFAGAGIGDLHRYFHAARQYARDEQTGAALFNLLEEVVIRRTRPFIRRAYPNATIAGKPVRWPDRKLKTEHYDLEATYEGIYERIVAGIEGLRLAHYGLESYKREGLERDEFEEGREVALIGIFKSRYLKRLESSVEAFRISVRRALAFVKTFEEFILAGRLLDSLSFERAMRYLAREDEEDDAMPTSVADELAEKEEAQEFLAGLPELDATRYDLKRLHRDLQHDVEILTEIWYLIKDIRADADDKLATVMELLGGPLKGQKVLLFTYYKDTARYLFRELGGEGASGWRERIGDPRIRRVDSGASPKDRTRIIEAFSPRSNGREELIGTRDEIDILISTDVLSEGQNLQDCGIVVNYDLHWNPTRMVQRAGRIDRIGSDFPTITIHNLFPEAGLERLLGLVESLNRKIAEIDATGFLDASVLGETVHPRNFNTLRRIRDEDGAVIEEQEQFVELASSEFMLQQLKSLLAAGARERLEALPDGIHSGLHKAGDRGLFFYFTAPHPSGDPQHFWRYYDLATAQIQDNRFMIANLIACAPDTPRVVGEADVFLIQERIQQHILESIQAQAAAEAAPTILDPVQQTVMTVLREHLNDPAFDRKEIRAVLRTLGQPMTRGAVRRLKEAYKSYTASGDVVELLTVVREGLPEREATSSEGTPVSPPLTADDLHLVCWEYVWS